MASPAAQHVSLSSFQPQHAFFVGIDSDGCAFDSMEIKHKECFCPNTVKHWNLQSVSKYAREAWDFVNLYSKWRGTNRWPALVMVLDLLRDRPEVIARHCAVDPAPALHDFIKSGRPLSNDGLKAYMAEHPSAELERALAWSNGINSSIADIVHSLPPFPYVRECLQLLQNKADCMVVSQTPAEALIREWEEHGIDRYVRTIAGQEQGTKKQHLRVATENRYAAGHVLMIGDAKGDLDAARENNALFFPVNPGHEEASWERLHKEGIPRFLAGEFAGEYESALIAEFERFLPATPPWKRNA